MTTSPLEARPRRAARPVSALATAAGTLLGGAMLIVATLVCGTIASIVGWIPPRGDWMYRVSQVWARLLLGASLVRVRAHFETPLDPKRGYVFMANHQSMFDIPVLLVTMPGQTRFLAKRGLFQIPIFGWGLTAGGFIPVDRKDRKAGAVTFAAAMDRLRRGRSIILFPEETRSDDGRLLPFKRGGFLLALRSGYPIVPVGIRGTHAVQSKAAFTISPGTVDVRFGAPIDPQDESLGGKGAAVEVVRERIAALMAAPGSE